MKVYKKSKTKTKVIVHMSENEAHYLHAMLYDQPSVASAAAAGWKADLGEWDEAIKCFHDLYMCLNEQLFE